MQGLFGFFQVFDGFVNAFDGFFKAFGGQAPVAAEGGFEVVELGLEVGDVYVLRLDHGQLVFVLERVHGGVAQQGDHGQEELRAHHVHLGVAVEHVDDAGVVELALGLKQ